MGMARRTGRFFRQFERIGRLARGMLLDVSRGKKTPRDFSLLVAAYMVKEGFCSFVDFSAMKDEVFFDMIDSLHIWNASHERPSFNK